MKTMREITIMMGILMFATIVSPMAALAQPPVPPGAKAIYYLVPNSTSAPAYCTSRTIEVWVNSSVNLLGGKVTIETSDKTCGNITGVEVNTTEWTLTDKRIEQGGKKVWMTFGVPFGAPAKPAGNYNIGNITVHCNSSTCCIAELNFVYETYITDENADDWDVPGQNGTFICGKPTEETYSKDLYEGWNLVSLPLTPSDNSTSSVLASVWENVSAVYRYNATSKQFERASTMDPGTGYFVYVTKNCTWTYSGTPYTSMSIELKKGLNMVGWLNCSKDITDALSSIAGDYWYVARWNAIERKFEVYNPVAPPVFNDFTTMERGEGYFISMKSDGTLTESC